MTEPIRVFVFGTGWGVPFPTSAPFPLKLCTWLRMAKVPHEIVIENDPRKGPKGKSPWIDDGGTLMGDSQIIIEHLSKRFGVDIDAHRSAWPNDESGEDGAVTTVKEESDTTLLVLHELCRSDGLGRPGEPDLSDLRTRSIESRGTSPRVGKPRLRHEAQRKSSKAP
jgi:hypothetical protein